MKKLLLLLALFFYIPTFAQQRLVDFVNPFIGTDAHGHTYPGATIPFGMVQLSPDNGTNGWDWCSGYHYSDSVIQGFSHTHLSGTGVGDLCDISVLPMVNKTANAEKIVSRFSHKQESAKPGYYAVHLKDFDVWAELSTTIRCGFHRYTFPASKQAAIRFDLGFSINYDRTKECYFKKINDSTFVGYRFSSGWAANQKIFFAVKTSKPIKSISLIADKEKIDTTIYTAKDIKASLEFETTQGEKILMKVGLSSADIEGALESLNEIQGWDFDAVKTNAENIWERELRKLQIRTNDIALKQTFYTALYHTYLAPNRFSDRYGNYKDSKGNIAKGKSIYTVQSLWDTFRAANPLLTLTQTELVPAIINSYLTFYDDYGLLPVWELQFNETNCMTGYHAVPVITDAILKGITGFDYEKAYQAMKASAYQNIRATDLYRQYGFVPYDKAGYSVTITMEYAFDDWCIAQVAKRLGKSADYREFIRRSMNWRNVFDKKTGFARPKNSNGHWVTPFDPYHTEHDENKTAYTEGNAWQHSWFAPHDVYALINYMGGAKKFTTKLDSLFNADSKLTGSQIPPDISGMIGQYVHGNEPSHHIAYLYNYVGLPHKTADRVREICTTLYSNKPDGLPGNEDCGQMSAWYVFSVLGFYPVNPASGEYVLSVPLVQESALQLPDGHLFRIIVKESNEKNKYIKHILLNGEPYTKSYIKHSDIMKGGILEITLDAEPGKNFGKTMEDFPGRRVKY
ncbi:MAG: GH92 family glycosyl hydrolase [Chitinophagaceae bacterium]|nr:GH92 family glycosyl hydrolase [Chitinophagaceae bacterium]MCW5904793.1 GH92 family glycosyl hydrolase [Chitinophagaceae bacterium]